MKPKIFSNYGQQVDFELDKPVEVYIDCPPKDRVAKPADVTRFMVLMEPDGILGFGKYAFQYADHWQIDHILTYNELILEKHPRARLFEFGTSWIQPDESTDKKFCVSNVCGKKGVTTNRLMREYLFSKKDKITIPTDFYVSGREGMTGDNVLGDYKDPLFESMFHIAIENYSLKYYFSEKLCDSLIRKTVPIYVGCSNIGDYFNADGIISCNSAAEIIQVCNKLTPDDYHSRMDAIEENFEKAKYWKNWPARLEAKLKELL